MRKTNAAKTLGRLNRCCMVLSGLPGYDRFAARRAAAIAPFEAETGRRISEPRRSLWLAQGAVAVGS